MKLLKWMNAVWSLAAMIAVGFLGIATCFMTFSSSKVRVFIAIAMGLAIVAIFALVTVLSAVIGYLRWMERMRVARFAKREEE